MLIEIQWIFTESQILSLIQIQRVGKLIRFACKDRLKFYLKRPATKLK